jgi:hypothetical protein
MSGLLSATLSMSALPNLLQPYMCAILARTLVADMPQCMAKCSRKQRWKYLTANIIFFCTYL